MRAANRRSRRGFTLRDVVFGLAVVLGILIIGAPFLLRQRAEARKNACLRNMDRVAIAILELEDLEGAFPGYCNQQLPSDPASREVGWAFPMLPYVQRSRADGEAPGPWAWIYDDYGPTGAPEFRGKEPDVRVPLLICPDRVGVADAPNALSHFVINGGLIDAESVQQGALADYPENGLCLNNAIPGTPPVSVLFVQSRDGADSTLMLAENTAGGRWSSGAQAEVAFHWDNVLGEAPNRRVFAPNVDFIHRTPDHQHARPSSFHARGFNVAMVSGASRFLADDVDERVFVRLMTSHDSELKTPGSGAPLAPPFGLQTNEAGPDDRVSSEKTETPQPTPEQ